MKLDKITKSQKDSLLESLDRLLDRKSRIEAYKSIKESTANNSLNYYKVLFIDDKTGEKFQVFTRDIDPDSAIDKIIDKVQAQYDLSYYDIIIATPEEVEEAKKINGYIDEKFDISIKECKVNSIEEDVQNSYKIKIKTTLPLKNSLTGTYDEIKSLNGFTTLEEVTKAYYNLPYNEHIRASIWSEKDGLVSKDILRAEAERLGLTKKVELTEAKEDGWGPKVQDLLSEINTTLDQFTYEIAYTIRGAYTKVETIPELADYVEQLGRTLISISDELADLEDDDDDDDEYLKESIVDEDKWDVTPNEFKEIIEKVSKIYNLNISDLREEDQYFNVSGRITDLNKFHKALEDELKSIELKKETMLEAPDVEDGLLESEGDK